MRKNKNKIVDDFYKRRIKPLKNQNWKAIALCVITASIFWFFNALNKDYTTRLEYPIIFEYNRDSIVSTVKLPSSVNINVSGGGWQLFRKTISFSNAPLIVTLEEPTEVNYLTRYSIMPLITDQFRELSINFVDTDTILLGFEPKTERTLALEVSNKNLNFSEYFEQLDEIAVDPDTITLSGPASFFDTLENSIEIAPELKGIDENIEARIRLSNYLPNHVKAEPSNVTLNIEVQEFQPMELMVPINKINFPTDTTTYLTEKEVLTTFWVLEERSGEVDVRDFFIIADYMGLNPMDSTLKLDLIQKPGYVQNVEIQPDRIKIVPNK